MHTYTHEYTLSHTHQRVAGASRRQVYITIPLLGSILVPGPVSTTIPVPISLIIILIPVLVSVTIPVSISLFIPIPVPLVATAADPRLPYCTLELHAHNHMYNIQSHHTKRVIHYTQRMCSQRQTLTDALRSFRSLNRVYIHHVT